MFCLIGIVRNLYKFLIKSHHGEFCLCNWQPEQSEANIDWAIHQYEIERMLHCQISLMRIHVSIILILFLILFQYLVL